MSGFFAGFDCREVTGGKSGFMQDGDGIKVIGGAAIELISVSLRLGGLFFLKKAESKA